MALRKTLLRSRDAAHILNCSPDDVIQLARRGKLKGTKAGRYWSFRPQDVMGYKKKQEEGG